MKIHEYMQAQLKHLKSEIIKTYFIRPSRAAAPPSITLVI